MLNLVFILIKLSLLLGGFFVSLGEENNEIYYICARRLHTTIG